jgi:hypothetical protein
MNSAPALLMPLSEPVPPAPPTSQVDPDRPRNGAAPASDPASGTERYSFQAVDEASAPGLSVRTLPHPQAPPDPLTGHELWHPVTDTVVLAGLRDAGTATRLLQLVPLGTLNRVLLRMATPSATSRRPAPTLGTLCAVSTLLCWPERRRAELIDGVAKAVEVTLGQVPRDDGGGAVLALRWVRRLASTYPDDPMVLAPLLLHLRFVGAGSPYVVAPGRPFAHLRGLAVQVVSVDTSHVAGGLGPADVDHLGFVAALTAGQAHEPVAPSPQTLAHLAELARRPATHLLQSSTEPRQRGTAPSETHDDDSGGHGSPDEE